jgi:hypothetical protein
LLGLLYPHNDEVTTGELLGWIEELVSIGSVRWRETMDGAPILELTNWAKHQRVDNKGRSQLAGFLAPFAAVRGEIPRVAASRGGSPLGSRKKEVGEGVGADAPSPLKPPRLLPPPWVAIGVAWWLANVGAMKPARFQAALRPFVEPHGWDAVLLDLQSWVKARKAAGKPTKLEWYADEAASRLTTMRPPIVDEFGCLTEYGERITRPVSA